jgi:predicted transcriptional regulator
MKIAVSIPDDIHAEADALAERLGTSRSDLFARALRAYLAVHSSDRITDALNAALADIDQEEDMPFVREAARQTIARSEW